MVEHRITLAYNTFSSMRNNVIQALTKRRECYVSSITAIMDIHTLGT